MNTKDKKLIEEAFYILRKLDVEASWKYIIEQKNLEIERLKPSDNNDLKKPCPQCHQVEYNIRCQYCNENRYPAKDEGSSLN